MTTTATYQTRRNADAEWTILAADPWAYRNSITEAMQRAGLRYSELTGHLEDMRAGHVLTADNGRQFRYAPVTDTAAALDAITERHGITGADRCGPHCNSGRMGLGHLYCN